VRPDDALVVLDDDLGLLVLGVGVEPSERLSGIGTRISPYRAAETFGIVA